MRRVIYCAVLVFGMGMTGWSYSPASQFPRNLPYDPQVVMDIGAYQAMVGGQRLNGVNSGGSPVMDSEMRSLREYQNLQLLTVPPDSYGIPDTTSPRMDGEEIR